MAHRLCFAGKKLLRMVPLLLGVSLAAFLLMSASPLDPLQTNVGQAALGTMSQEQIAQLEDYWGVNDPPLERYLGWLTDVLHGDLGTSLLYRVPVTQVLAERLKSSLWHGRRLGPLRPSGTAAGHRGRRLPGPLA